MIDMHYEELVQTHELAIIQNIKVWIPQPDPLPEIDYVERDELIIRARAA